MTNTMMSVREKIYWAIKPWHGKKYARIYDIVMLIAIAVGILPLMFRYHYEAFWYLNLFSGFCFVLDYILRWMTADFEMKKYRKWESFVWYPFTPMAIIDLLSILPVFNLLNPTFKVARLTRLLMTLRVFKAIRYFEPLEIVLSVIRKYLFETFFEAFYWAACTLTTVGYGDLYPISSIGRIISIISSMVGIAIIALPSGIITAGYMDEQRSRREKKEPHSES